MRRCWGFGKMCFCWLCLWKRCSEISLSFHSQNNPEHSGGGDLTVCWNGSHANSSVFLSAPRGHYFLTRWRSTGPWVSKRWVGLNPALWLQSSRGLLWHNLPQLSSSREDPSQLFSTADLGLDVCFSILLLAFLHFSFSLFPLACPGIIQSLPWTPDHPLSFTGPW